MKKLFTQSLCLALIAAGLLLSTWSHAQVPQKFNYQGIARDVKGNPIGKQTLALKLSVLPTEDASVAEYEETQIVTTNEFGLYTLQIGNGSPLIGDMKTVKWETGNKYIRVAIDPKGGSDYTVIGTSQLLSVPYAIYADKAGLARETVGQDGKTRTGAVSSNAAHVAGDANYVTKFTALNTIGKSLIFDNGSRVGIGTNAPLASGLLHLKSATGTQPLILESPQGVHNLIQENGINRGYFGSYIGSGGAYPTPAGTSDADFDIGTSGASTGKLHFATNTTPRVTILPTTGFVGVGTTSPSTMFQVNKATDPTFKLSNTASGATTTDGLDITLSGSNASINNRESGSLQLNTANTSRVTVTSTGSVGVGTNSPITRMQLGDLNVDSANTFTIGTRGADSGAAGPRTSALALKHTNKRFGTTIEDIDDTSGTLLPLPGLNIKTHDADSIGVSRLYINRATGNVGIGTTSPFYKLQVDHSGSTGILVKSTGSFSVLDIDGQSGDAALRFAANGVNQWNVRNRPADNYFQIFELGGGGSRLVIQDGTGYLGLNQDNPTARLDIGGNIKITDGTQGLGKVLTSDGTGLATWQTPATPAIVASTGTTNYIPKFTTNGTELGNSQIRDNGTSLSVGSTLPSLISQLYVYRQQLTINGDGQSTLMGYRTRDSQNDGTGYSQIQANDATRGYNFWGDVYTFGVGGWNYNDYSRCGGTFGAEVNGTYWGSLGYRSSGLLNYGVYGSGAYASGGGQLPDEEVNGVGGGFFGTIGSLSKGSAIGQLNEGELFAAYNKGDVYTSGKQIELVTNNDIVTPSYAVTSSEVTVYNKGKIQLVNGSAYVAFDENYRQLLGETPIVTVSPMGECNGVYIASVSKEGFMVKEQNHGNSNTDIAWIAVGNRVDANSTEIPAMLTKSSFNRNLSKALHNDGNKKQNGTSMWWNGKELEFGEDMPAKLKPTREQKEKLLEQSKNGSVNNSPAQN